MATDHLAVTNVPVGDEPVGSALARLREAWAVLRAAQAEIDATVGLARSQGATWAQIGGVAGMTRQAAHERWGHVPRGGCQHVACDCPQHQASSCPCGHGPGRGYRPAIPGPAVEA